ncbi:MAG: DUF1080 domain-containing protein [Ekhidna sp.]|nr:DUF1080 domain-containing protein [Ekhidna sp.]
MKKINNRLLFSIAAGFIFSCQPTQKEKTDTENKAEESVVEKMMINTLTEEEKADGWMLLFDGSTSDGWRGYKKDSFPKAWEIIDGSIHIQGSGRGELGNTEGGDIIYEVRKFGDFHLKLEWMVDSAANSGIFYRGQEAAGYDYIWQTSPEMQVLDNENHPDANKGKDGNRQSGSLYDLIPANPQNAKPFREWNQVEVLAVGNSIKHIQNGDTVVSYVIGSEELTALIADSKWSGINENWGNIASEGFIGLQDHGDDVWFRNIKIKEL